MALLLEAATATKTDIAFVIAIVFVTAFINRAFTASQLNRIAAEIKKLLEKRQ